MVTLYISKGIQGIKPSVLSMKRLTSSLPKILGEKVENEAFLHLSPWQNGKYTCRKIGVNCGIHSGDLKAISVKFMTKVPYGLSTKRC